MTQASDVYSFGPTATVFAQPVLVTLPLSQNYATSQGQLTIYRINPTSGVSELIGGTYDSSANTVSAQVYQFSSPSLGKPNPGRRDAVSGSSSMFVGFAPTSPYDYGCLYPVNSDAGNFRSVTTQSYTLSYPAIDANFAGATSTWGISCLDGWCPQGNWFLPQGQYLMCIQETDKNTLVTTHSDPIPATINQPFHASNNITNIVDSVCPNTFPLGAGLLPNAGPCPTTPIPTTTSGTNANGGDPGLLAGTWSGNCPELDSNNNVVGYAPVSLGFSNSSATVTETIGSSTCTYTSGATYNSNTIFYANLTGPCLQGAQSVTANYYLAGSSLTITVQGSGSCSFTKQ